MIIFAKDIHVCLHTLIDGNAIHLMDRQVDLRAIQELVKHKSNIPTEFYTHLSMRNLKDVRNVLNDTSL